MDALPFALVLISIFTHAYWNYLIKRSENKHVFTALSKLAEVMIFAIPAIYYIGTSGFKMEFLPLILVAALITFLNYFFLASAYKQGDLSMVYPVSRSSVIFLPVLAFYCIDERIDAIGVSAIAMILIGTFVMHMESLNQRGLQAILKSINNKGSIYAILAAFTVAGYTLWDKISISKMEPFLYFYMYTLIVAILYNSMTILTYTKEKMKREWKLNRFQIIQVGFFNSFTYLLILTALSMSKVAYIGGLRQLSIVIGAFLGYKLLGEKMSLPKIIGIVISIIGGSLVYLAK